MLVKLSLFFFDGSNNSGAINVKLHESALDEKSSFKMLGLSLSYKLDWVSWIVSIAKTAFKKLLEIILLSCLGWCS